MKLGMYDIDPNLSPDDCPGGWVVFGWWFRDCRDGLRGAIKNLRWTKAFTMKIIPNQLSMVVRNKDHFTKNWGFTCSDLI